MWWADCWVSLENRQGGGSRKLRLKHVPGCQRVLIESWDEERIGERVGKIVEGCGMERRLVFDVVMTPGCRRSEEMIWISLICRSMIERSSRSGSGNISRKF